ncbi:hypothetical protein [Micromonospora maritima]|uniref:hypothetical protein n=1 Tax=Micromonospora maritima TaxID=986711 RepID=UPI00157E1BE2|nr:hypothetical protein [Micromonospora maritima]
MAKSANPIKTFTKDGKERAAYSPSDVVALRFDGWVEKTEQASAPAKTNGAASTKPDSSNQSR